MSTEPNDTAPETAPPESPIGQYFIENLRRARERKGWSLTEFSRHMREDLRWTVFHPTTMTRIEAGERKVRLEEADALAFGLGMDLADLLAAPAPTEALLDTAEAQAIYQDKWWARERSIKALEKAKEDLRAAIAVLHDHIRADDFTDDRQRCNAKQTLDNARLALKIQPDGTPDNESQATAPK